MNISVIRFSRTALTGNEIGTIFNENGYNWPALLDNVYVLPDFDWIRFDFAIALKNWLESNGMAQYEPEGNDCDDFADNAATLAEILYFNSPDRIRGTSLAIGTVKYMRRDGIYHALNCFVSEQKKVSIFEPQLAVKNQPPVLSLTAEEIRSAVVEI